MQKILLAEDDPNLGELLKDYLELKGKFDVTLCQDGEEALVAFHKDQMDFAWKDIRKTNTTVPVIYATAKGMMEDKTQAFELGGDDYITKPFRVEELLLRINALLKRSSRDKEEETADKFEIGDYFFDYTSQQISYKGQQQKLSTKEAELLRLLCLKKNDVLTREEALLKIWHDDNYFHREEAWMYS
ncbi:hypothetical protein FQR65_LT19370 [Abscondita terminalis]|nr:hypothetical protein FQR65_LT19370 [Abscondita terminalis]